MSPSTSTTEAIAYDLMREAAERRAADAAACASARASHSALADRYADRVSDARQALEPPRAG